MAIYESEALALYNKAQESRKGKVGAMSKDILERVETMIRGAAGEGAPGIKVKFTTETVLISLVPKGYQPLPISEMAFDLFEEVLKEVESTLDCWGFTVTGDTVNNALYVRWVQDCESV